MIGQIVNYRYEVLEKVGDGEIFAVYKARDKVLNRLVALKVMSRQLAADREFAAAVANGYQDVAGLTHPNIARVVDADCTADDCVVACEFARGSSLKDRLERAGAAAVPLALEVMVPVLEALEYAHANRVVHGDIRPADIMVSPDGEVKLTDFGLSTALSRFPAMADRFQMRSIQYQAPEIVEGSPATNLSDVYSVGAVLYELLTNSKPFGGGSAVSIALRKVKETPTPPRQINAGIPKSLEDIIMKAMEVAPRDRYQSVGAMLADLRALRDSLRVGQPVPASAKSVNRVEVAAAEREPAEEPNPFSRGYWGLLALFVIVVVVVGGITLGLMGDRREVTVPPLLGKSWEQAQAEAESKGIELINDGTAFSETWPAGKICAVMPPAGSTVPKSNPLVKVKISSGPSMVAVPDLVAMSEADASDAAVKAGFTIGKATMQFSDKVPINSVISQEPEAGLRRSPGSAIDLVISQGPKPETPPTTPENGGGQSSELRRFDVTVSVPAEASEPQEVLIKVFDDRGETVAYQQMRDPGDKFTQSVTAEGSDVTIEIYVGGVLVKRVQNP